jgi:hypothetical protein
MKKVLLSLFLGLTLMFQGKSQNCITITSAILTNPSGDNITWRLTVNYAASGIKHFNTIVTVSGDTTIYTCTESHGNNNTGVVIYNNIIAPGGLSTIHVRFNRYTGTCDNGTICGGSQCLDHNVLDLKIKPISARNVNNHTQVMFQVFSIDETNAITFNFTLPNNTVKKYRIILSEKARPGDIWLVTINNINGTYTSKKY